MKIIQGFFLLAALTGMTGCASIGPPQAPSLELPKPPADLHATRKGDRVMLTWSVPVRTTDRQSVRYLGTTEICRSVVQALKQCRTPVGEVARPAEFEQNKNQRPAKKLTATFTDKLNSAMEREHVSDSAVYAVEVMNSAGRGAGISNQVRVPVMPTLPPFTNFAAQTGDQGVTISWKCPELRERTSDIEYLFRIYRRMEGSATETKIADVKATECVVERSFPPESLSQSEKDGGLFKATDRGPGDADSFLDNTIEWEKTYFYRGTVVSVLEKAGRSAAEVEGDDTPEIKIFAHDIFPPAVPSGLQAVFSGPGQAAFIDLIWTPVSDADLDGYNVYRRQEAGVAARINSQPVKTPAFRDANVAAGQTYFYSVSAVDERGNESARSAETSETVP